MSLLNTIYSFLQYYAIEILIVITLGIFDGVTKKIRKYLRYSYAYVTNKPIRFRVQLIEKYYNKNLKAFLSNAVFDDLVSQVQADKITKGTVSQHFMEINSENLGMPITISVSEEHETSELGLGEQASIIGYGVIAKTEAELVGFRMTEDLQDFINIASVASRSIGCNCFGNSHSDQSFVICDIRNFIKKSQLKEEHNDKKLGSRMAVHDGILTVIVSGEPNNLVRAVKKSLVRYS
jgi:hypothetical protein